MNILVQGPGAVGRYLAVRLVRSGESVVLLDRDAERARRISEAGIRVTGGDLEGERVPVPAVSVTEPIPSGILEENSTRVLICCVKAYDTQRALEQGWHHLGEDGLILVLSNGLGNLEAAEALATEDRCLAGTITCGVMRDGSGGIRFHGPGRMRVGTRGRLASGAPARTAAKSLTDGFRRAGFEAETVPDIEPVVWEKVAVNCAINPVGAILGVENGKLPGHPAFDDGVLAARETAAVARSLGVDLPPDGWRARAEEVCRNTPTNRCSMLVDLEENRRTEIDALCGAVRRIGEEQGVPTPACDSLTRKVHSLEGRQGTTEVNDTSGR